MIGVGYTIWRFDENRRVYLPAPEGRIWSNQPPIYREHWHQVEIKGETSRSWLTSYGKVPKRGEHHGWAFTEDEVNAACWVNDHRPKIITLLTRCRDAAVIERVAKVLGYKAEEKR